MSGGVGHGKALTCSLYDEETVRVNYNGLGDVSLEIPAFLAVLGDDHAMRCTVL